MNGDARAIGAGRAVHLEGPSNVRDLGGLPTGDGRVTRWRTLYRADSLALLTVADVRRLDELGIRTVFDLRSDVERSRAPHPKLAAQTATVLVDLAAAVASAADHGSRDDGEALLLRLYTAILYEGSVALGRLLRAISTDDALPAIVHCTAGKDRTGVAVAVLLAALRVRPDAIIADYRESETQRSAEHRAGSYDRLLAMGMPPAAAAAALGAPPAAMASVLASIDELHGGVDAYLRAACGLTGDEVERLRERLLEEGHE